MKKTIVYFLLIFFAFSLSLCGCKGNKTSDKEDDVKQEAKKDTEEKKDKIDKDNKKSENVTEEEGENIDEETDEYALLTEQELKVRAYDRDPEAAYRLGLMYDYGTEEINQNFENAKKWYEKAASYGHAKAYTALGYMNLNGIGTAENLTEAENCFNKADSMGDPHALTGLGRLYLKKEDPGMARQYFSMADAANVIDGILYMGEVYDEGIGTGINPDLAMAQYKKVIEMAEREDVVVEKPDEYVVNEAHVRAGILLMKSQEEPVPEEEDANKEEALVHFTVAANAGYAPAQYYLGVMYINGYGTKKDYDDGREWLLKAADQNYAPALNELGCLYFNGKGVESDLSQTLFYQKLAAAQDYTPAQVNLGYLYENGYGVEKNLYTARDYYRLAAEKGYEGASDAVLRIESELKEH